ncbi:MAG: RNA-binding transcriptional accessory protein [Bacteroidetes bacterium]|nr:MAG: RNA-binding transcriptional accessory protein [Bacteroidota bacterium]
MNDVLSYASSVSTQLQISVRPVQVVLQLLAEGATIPFLARYRKDQTGNLDEVQIEKIQDEAKRQLEFAERKAFIVKAITEQGKMTDALMASLDAATSVNGLEDIYLPFKPKRRTKAQEARENGLEPLSVVLLAQQNVDVEAAAAAFVGPNVATIADALQGARHIVAELVSEDADVRAKMRRLFEQDGWLISRVVADKTAEAAKYKDYFDYKEAVVKVPGHRGLAVLRGFMEGMLRISIEAPAEEAVSLISKQYITSAGSEAEHLRKAIEDAYKRLLQPALESEFRMALKQRSDEEAINVFADNLRQLLLSAPLGGKRLLAIDPGYRTGCKTVCLNENGELLVATVIYIHEANRLNDAQQTLRHLVATHSIEAIAIGDGTAGRETEKFVKSLALQLPVYLVNEDGASIYSASEVARDEFPDQDITVRGAVSIGRRLMDPLAELVKIDPKSIGVGQYQHDVNQTRLKEKLDTTVVSCVNAVGVNLNTASKNLLSYVSGIGEGLAKNIVDYRKEKGQFTNRKQLLEVPRLGAKAFEQCAGFLRVKNSTEPLDASAVHPECYPLVQNMAADLGVDVASLMGNTALLNSIDKQRYTSFGAFAVSDVLAELKKPGLDPRATATHFEFGNVYSIDDVKIGDILPGIVTNITKFGAFVDVGVKQDGLVHVSEIAHRYIADPAEALKLGQHVMVKVTDVDKDRQRIALSIKQTQEAPGRQAANLPRVKGQSAPPARTVAKPAASANAAAGSDNLNDALAQLKQKFKRS